MPSPVSTPSPLPPQWLPPSPQPAPPHGPTLQAHARSIPPLALAPQARPATGSKGLAARKPRRSPSQPPPPPHPAAPLPSPLPPPSPFPPSSRSLLERLQPAGSPSQPPMVAACPSYLSFLPPEALQYATKPCEITAPGGTEITLRNTEPTASHPSIRERLTRVATGIPYHSVSSLRVLLMRTPPNAREFQLAGRQWPLPGREPSPAQLGNCTDDLEAGAVRESNTASSPADRLQTVNGEHELTW